MVENGGLWLVNRRDAPDELNGLWEFPGGKMHHAETPYHAAVRECREEVAIEVAPIRALSVRVYDGGPEAVELHPIVCRLLRGRAQPADGKIGPTRWVGLDELRSLAMPPANREIVAELSEHFRVR